MLPLIVSSSPLFYQVFWLGTKEMFVSPHKTVPQMWERMPNCEFFCFSAFPLSGGKLDVIKHQLYFL